MFDPYQWSWKSLRYAARKRYRSHAIATDGSTRIAKLRAKVCPGARKRGIHEIDHRARARANWCNIAGGVRGHVRRRYDLPQQERDPRVLNALSKSRRRVVDRGVRAYRNVRCLF